jgi:hypothetical protein
MPTFKPKNTKKIMVSHKLNTTLDGKHNELLKEFKINDKELIPSLKKEKAKIKKKIKENNLSIDEKLELEDRLIEIKKQIIMLKTDQKEYLLSNSEYVFDYFESKKKIAEGTNKTTLLDNFFKININKDNNNNTKPSQEITNIQKYLANVDETFLDIGNFVVQTNICHGCYKGELIPEDHEGIMVCNNCFRSIRYLVENEKPSYKEPPKEVCFYAYKRINHFREILAQFQAKETTQIPDVVLENIRLQIKKERIKLEQITNKKAKDILKKLGYNKYYEHIPFIKDKLGIKPPIMSPELEETLCNLFMEIQGPYARYCPEDRVNFLNYYYTVYKLCELLDQHQFLPFFPMLKDREKRIEQDEIWKKICLELNWEFIPTI